MGDKNWWFKDISIWIYCNDNSFVQSDNVYSTSSKYKSVVVELSASLSFMIFCNGVLSCINGTEFFGSYYINYVFTVIYFILNGLVPLLWFKYMYIFYDTSPKKSTSYITTIPYLLYLLLIFINCFTWFIFLHR